MGQEARCEEVSLLREVIAGRAGAWERFYRRYERLIIACVRRVMARYGVVCQPSDTEDLLNTVCLQLVRDDYHKLRRFDPSRGYRVSSWVGLIATNTAHDALRRREPQAYSLDADDALWSEQPAEGLSPLDVAQQHQQQATVNQAVRQLSPREQLFVRYYYVEQRSAEEIAELMGININTVYSRKNKVRASLQHLVDVQS